MGRLSNNTWSKMANCTFFLSFFNVMKWFISCNKVLGKRTLKRTRFFLVLWFFAIYHSPFFPLHLGMLIRAFLLPSCFFRVSHLGCITFSFLSIVEHTLHLTVCIFPLTLRVPSAQGSFGSSLQLEFLGQIINLNLLFWFQSGW